MKENDQDWKSLYEQELQARKQAERASHSTSDELFTSNEALKAVNANLEEIVRLRTQDLKQSEMRFRRMVESAHDMIYRLNLQGRFVYVNPTTIKALGFTNDELMYMTYLDLIDEEHRERVKQFYREMTKQRQEQSYFELPIRAKDGRLFWVGQNVTIFYHETGKPSYISGVARDITDAKLANSRLSNLIGNLQSAILLEDDQRRIVLTNADFLERFKIPGNPEDVVGVDCSASAEMSKGLFVESELFVERIDTILAEKKTVKNEVLRMKDGSVLERDYIPIFIDGQYSGHLWNYRDITASQQHQKDLEVTNVSLEHNLRQQQLLADISFDLINEEVDFHAKINQTLARIGGFLNVSRVYIFEDDQEGKHTSNTFEWCNTGVIPQLEELQEVPYEHITYWPTTLSSKGMIFSEDITTLPEEVQAILEPQGIKSLLVYPLQKKGSMFGFIGFDECAYHRVWDQSNIQLLKTISNLIANEYQRRNDHLALVKSRKEALEAASAKEAFLANMSHEIRTPMNGVAGMIMALKKTATTSEQDYFLDTMKRAADNLLVILNDILDLSKIAAGKLNLDSKPFEFRSVLQQPVQVLQHRIDDKGLVVRVEVDPKIATYFLGDPYRIDQIFMNLLGNAVKFTDQGEILLQATLVDEDERQQRIHFRVQDHGIGMDEAFMEQLFEKFTQEDRGVERGQGGTGLGLNITKQLVEMMGGSIEVESTLGEGSTFSVELSLEVAKAEDPEVAEISAMDDSKRLKGTRILAAEDNELNRVVLETVLGHYGVKLHSVVNGLEAVKALQHEDFDLVLMDLQMPEMDGVTAVKKIRSELQLDLPIIALSADALKAEREAVEQAGMNGYIPKPFEEHQLISTIAQHLKEGLVKKHRSSKMKEQWKDDEIAYSLSKLEAMSRGKRAFVVRMCDIFVRESRNNLALLVEAFDENNGAEVARLAHRMKPSIDNMGIVKLHDAVRLLERTKDEGCTGFEDVMARFEDHLERVCQQIEKDVLMNPAWETAPPT